MTTVGGILRARAGLAALVATLLLPIIVIAAYSWGRTRYPSPIDYSLFGPAGADLLTGHWSEVFRDPQVQAGPFEIIPYGIARLLHVHGPIGWTVFYASLTWVLVFAFVAVLFVALGPVSTRWALYLGIGAGALAVLTGYVPSATFLGHPAQVIIPVCWVLAACLARDRQFVLCGVVVAASAGWELWGVLGAPVLLLAARPRYLRAALGALVAVAALYLPFVLLGPFRMFGFSWSVSDGTVIHLLWPGLETFPWSLRLAQSVVAVGLGCVAAVLVRDTDYGVWLVPLAVLATRLLLDPTLFGYYWFAPATVAIGLLAVAVHRRSWLSAGLAAAVVAWFLFPQWERAGGAIGLFILVAAATVAIGLLRLRRSRGLRVPHDRMLDRMTSEPIVAH